MTAALLGALVLQTAAPATAAAYGCSIAVPSTVSIIKPYTLITARLGADCVANGEDWAAWDVRHSYYGPSGMFLFDGTSSETEGFYDSDHYGTYYVEPGLAYDSNFNLLTQNKRSYVVKSGSRAYASATRAGSYVTVKASATYYNPSADAFRPWKQHKVVIQYRTPYTSTWVNLKTVYTDSYGRASTRFYAPKSRFYRVASYSSSLVWSRTSAAVAR